MGVTIHYNCKIKNQELLTPLKKEMKDIAESLHWDYHVKDKLETSQNDCEDIKEYLFNNMEGICITPPSCESLNLYFLPDGRLLPMIVFAYPNEDVELALSSPDFHPTLKTQFGGVETHKKIVNIMKYCFSKYMKDVEVFDESLYYETEDEKHLQEVMNGINKSRAALEEAFELHKEELQNVSPDKMAEEIQKILGTELKKMKVIVSRN